MDIGAPELIIVLVIVLLVFGVGRVANLGGELGKAIHAFRSALQSDEKEAPAAAESEKTEGEQTAPPREHRA